MRLRLATRASAQALTQSRWVADRLTGAHPGLDVELVEVRTAGDRDTTSPIWQLGGKGIFAKEVQVAVLSGEADITVHSGKDLPSGTPDGLAIAAVPARRDPRDALVGATLADLPPGARVATGSIRRRAQLAWLRPDLTFASLRGSIGTRLERASDHDAIVIAAAALAWLGLEDRASDVLEPAVMVPQVAQGALAVECRADDPAARDLLAAIEDPVARRCFDAERAFLAHLGGDCNLPAGAYAEPADGCGVQVVGMIGSLDGHVLLRARGSGADPAETGRGIAAHLLDQGGRSLLER